MYHSQNDEAEVILKYFNGRVGRLLDIGANNGVKFSNSYDLIQLGWQADLVEPSDAYYAIPYNPNVLTFKVGVSKVSGNAIFYDCADTLLSTINKNLAGQQDKRVKEKTIDVITFAQLLELTLYDKYNFITIDAEGEDWNILQQMNLSELGCECLCIEHGNSPEMEANYIEYCAQFGLKPIHRTFENLILAI